MLSCPALAACGQQYDPWKKYGLDALKEDFLVFRYALEESHPGLYSFRSKGYMDSVFSAAQKRLQGPMSELDLVRILAGITAQIGCGHTAVAASDDYWALHLNREPVLFPLLIRYIGKEMYVREDNSGTNSLPVGTRILTINGTAIPELTKKLFSMIPGDGFIETSKYVQLNVDFYLYYNILIGSPAEFVMDCELPGGEKKTVTLKAMKASALKKVRDERLAKLNLPKFRHLRLKIYPDSGIGVLTVHTFSHKVLRKNKEKFKSFIKSAFRLIKRSGVKNLIIDLRWNTGGEDTYEGYLYSFIADSVFRVYRNNYITTQKAFSYPNYMDKPYRFNLYKKMAVKNEVGKDEIRFLKMRKWKKPKKENHFGGKVYVIINGGTFSAASSFASLANHHKRAIFIGEESGGDYYGCNGVVYPQLILPNTSVRVRFPLVRNVFDVKGFPARGRGVMPDYPVERSVEDLMANRDTELRFAIDLILKNKMMR
ncbi:MAG: S41 family peptidase [Bacteroidota bacterium]